MRPEGTLRVRGWAIELPLREPFVTASGTVTSRRLAAVAVEQEGLVGWGEAAPYPGHGGEDFEQAWDCLRSGLDALPGTSAAAALDEALTDLAAKARGVPLWSHLGGEVAPVAASAALGLATDVGSVHDAVEKARARGYRAAKLKIGPETAPETIAAVVEAFPTMTFGADANGSLTVDDPRLAALDTLGLAYLEQPIPPGDLAGLAELARRLHTPIVLDESATDDAAIEQALDQDAGLVFNLKAGRLGTSTAAALARRIGSAGCGVRIGGLVESGIGRGHALALATLPEAGVVGDLAASDHFFTTDIVDPPWRLDDAGMLHPPMAPGIGVDVDRDALERHAFDHFALRT